jgi:hypothetical protein
MHDHAHWCSDSGSELPRAPYANQDDIGPRLTREEELLANPPDSKAQLHRMLEPHFVTGRGSKINLPGIDLRLQFLLNGLGRL